MSHTDEQAKLWELIKDTRYGMLTHRHGDGQLHSHPLTTQNKKLDEGATLYFFIPKDGEIARHVATDPSVNVAYADTDADSYVSVSGQATLQEDAAKKEELFNTMAKSWFPKGAGASLGVVLLHVAGEIGVFAAIRRGPSAVVNATSGKACCDML